MISGFVKVDGEGQNLFKKLFELSPPRPLFVNGFLPLRMIPVLHLLPETAPQRAVWCSWPGNPDTWPRTRRQALSQYADLVSQISRLQPVELICPSDWQPEASKWLKSSHTNLEQVTWHSWPLNDAWCRDNAPLFVQNASGSLETVDLTYNAWGEKYPPWEDDDRIAERVSEYRNLTRHRVPIIGEGGALEVNSAGVLLTTESVWLHPNRNPGLSRQDAESMFSAYFGIRETLWLPRGFEGDDTDGHIDTLARFVDDRTVVVPKASPDHPDAELLRQNRDLLSETFEVIPLPHPSPRISLTNPARRLPLTYANFLIMNQAVLMPTYAEPETDHRAVSVLQECFPRREVLPIPCEYLMEEGGAVHCLTMQEPLPARD